MRGDLGGAEENEGIIQRSLKQLMFRLGEKDYTDITIKSTYGNKRTA